MEELKKYWIKKNLKFWEKLGVEVSEEEIKLEFDLLPEVPGFNRFIFIPKGISSSELVWLMNTKFKNQKNSDQAPCRGVEFFPIEINTDLTENLEKFSITGRATESYAIVARPTIFPDQDSMKRERTCLEWEKTDNTMRLQEYLIAAKFFWDEETENNKCLDYDGHSARTYFPENHVEDKVITASFWTNFGRQSKYIPWNISVLTAARDLKISEYYPPEGIRRVIRKDTDRNIIEEYRKKPWEYYKPQRPTGLSEIEWNRKEKAAFSKNMEEAERIVKRLGNFTNGERDFLKNSLQILSTADFWKIREKYALKSMSMEKIQIDTLEKLIDKMKREKESIDCSSKGL